MTFGGKLFQSYSACWSSTLKYLVGLQNLNLQVKYNAALNEKLDLKYMTANILETFLNDNQLMESCHLSSDNFSFQLTK